MPVATTVKRGHKRRNWFVNPGAEGSDLSQWQQYFSCPRAVSTEDKYSGTQSMKYTPNSTTNLQGPICYVTPATADRPWSGAVIRSSMWVKGTAGWVVSVSTRCATTGATYEGLNAQSVTLSGAWQRLSVTSTLPYASSGLSMEFTQFGIQMPTSAASPRANQPTVVYYIDNVCIEVHYDGQPFDYDDDYFDGSTAGCQWLGAANAAYSEKTTPVKIPASNTRIYRTDSTRNMVKNGFGELGNNTNFLACVYDAADKPASDPAVQGSFYATTNAVSVFSAERYPVNLTSQYVLSLWARQRVAGETTRAYSCFSPIDRANNIITPANYMYQANTTTTLAQNLVNGATKVYLTSAANWSNAAGANTYLRTITFWDWVDTFGTLWPTHTYSRATFNDMYNDGAVDYAANTITLRSAWTGGTFLAGRPVSNGSSGSSYIYVGMPGNTQLTTTWTHYTGVPVSGRHSGPTNSADTTKAWPYGTDTFRVLFLLNRSTSTSRHALAGVKVTSTGPWWIPATIRRGGP